MWNGVIYVNKEVRFVDISVNRKTELYFHARMPGSSYYELLLE